MKFATPTVRSLVAYPDRNDTETAAERFQAIQEAHQTLGNPELRRQYDVLGPLFHLDGRPPNADDIRNVFTSTVKDLSAQTQKRKRHRAHRKNSPAPNAWRGASHYIVRENHCRSCDGTGAQLLPILSPAQNVMEQVK